MRPKINIGDLVKVSYAIKLDALTNNQKHMMLSTNNDEYVFGEARGPRLGTSVGSYIVKRNGWQHKLGYITGQWIIIAFTDGSVGATSKDDVRRL